jgi:hypothetical protein
LAFIAALPQLPAVLLVVVMVLLAVMVVVASLTPASR